jgi:hypothetical protein
MIIKCSWCGAHLGEKPPYNDQRVTHSICKTCSDDQLKEIRRIKAKRLGLVVMTKKDIEIY